MKDLTTYALSTMKDPIGIQGQCNKTEYYKTKITILTIMVTSIWNDSIQKNDLNNRLTTPSTKR